MAPSNLQGLNIVQPQPQQNPYLSDQDLLAVPPFPDLSAQLDLWTNLHFQSDEPLVSRKQGLSEKRDSIARSEDDGEGYGLGDDELHNTGKIAEAAAHENVVTGTIIPPAPVPTPAAGGLPQLSGFDISSLLASFAADPFQLPPIPAAPSASMPSLAQLLSYHSNGTLPPFNMPPMSNAAHAPTMQNPLASAQSASANATPAPAPKRARTSRASTISEPSPSEVSSPVSPDGDEKFGSPVAASEDKRRRNTAASARFRLKKKEREAALEKKAKELETRVSELEKECEALRRENGWLKGLVVGVTGAGAVQQQQATAGMKRPRDEAGADSPGN